MNFNFFESREKNISTKLGVAANARRVPNSNSIVRRTVPQLRRRFNRNRAKLQTEIGIPPVRRLSSRGGRTSYPGNGAPYRRESCNCSIKQPLRSQISPVTRVYLVMAVSRLAAFPRNFRLVTSDSCLCRETDRS